MAGTKNFARSGQIDVTATTAELRICTDDMEASIRALSGVLINKPVLSNVTSVTRLTLIRKSSNLDTWFGHGGGGPVLDKRVGRVCQIGH